MFLLLIQFDLITEVIDRAIDANTDIAGSTLLLKDIFIFTFASLHKWRKQKNTCPFGQAQHCISNLLECLLTHLTSAFWTVWMTDASVEQTQVVVDFGHGANGRAWVMSRALLIDGDSGREAVNVVNVGLFHLVQELASVGR